MLFLSVISACTPATVVPDPPDLDATVRAYDAPTGTFDASNVASFLLQASSELTLVNLSDPVAFLSALSSSVSTRLADDGLPESNDPPPASSIKVDAVIRVDQTCLAWDPSVPLDATANGTLHIQTVVRESVLSRVLWGTANQCRLGGTGSADATIDGSLSIYRYDTLFTNPADARFLIRVDGTLRSNSLAQAAFDFRISPGSLEIRITLPSGDVIATLTDGKIGVRAKNGVFICDTSAGTCVPGD